MVVVPLVLIAAQVLLNLFLSILVINPVKKMSSIAAQVSMGNSEVPEFVHPGSDEIATLSVSLNRLRRSLHEAFKLLAAD